MFFHEKRIAFSFFFLVLIYLSFTWSNLHLNYFLDSCYLSYSFCFTHYYNKIIITLNKFLQLSLTCVYILMCTLLLPVPWKYKSLFRSSAVWMCKWPMHFQIIAEKGNGTTKWGLNTTLILMDVSTTDHVCYFPLATLKKNKFITNRAELRLGLNRPLAWVFNSAI